jgi:hypothetical protein
MAGSMNDEQAMRSAHRGINFINFTEWNMHL